MPNSSPAEPDPTRDFLVYRDRIGVASEIAFSRRQYLGFRTLHPVWIGRFLEPEADRIGSSLIRVGGVAGLLLRHFAIAPALDHRRFVPVIHAQFARGGALALPLARAMNAPLVVTLHGGDVGKDRNWRHTLLARRWPEVIARTHRFVCVSHAVARTAARRGVPESLLEVLPIGVEIPSPAVDAARTGFLFAGRFVEKKGITVLADAMRILRARGDMTTLVCAGDGPLRDVLRTLAQDVPGVELTGWLSQSQIAAAMEAARALVVPSLVAADGDAEGLPSVVTEAMARRCVVIGTNEGGIAEAVTDETTGLLVQPRDPAALAEAMHRIAQDAGVATRLAWAAFKVAQQRFDAVRQSAALEAILLAAAESR